jgi:hypothetical protein
VPEQQCLPQRELEHLLGRLGERDMLVGHRRLPIGRGQRRDQGLPSGLARDAERLDGPDRQALRLGQQAEGQVLGADVVVPVLTGLVLSSHDHPPRAVGEPGERVRVCLERLLQQSLPVGILGHEALLRRLLGDAHGPADVGPGRARLARLVDEVADQVVGQLAQVLRDPHGRRHVVQRRAFLAPDVAD